MFLEHKLLYAHKEEIPEGEYTIPLGEAKVKREGKDLTIISWSREVNFSLEAAETLAQEGIDVEVLDLRTLVPLERVCGLNIVSPFSPVLEDQNFPHPADIVAAVKRVLNQ